MQGTSQLRRQGDLRAMHGVRDELRKAIQAALQQAVQKLHPEWDLETLDTIIHRHTVTSHISIDCIVVAGRTVPLHCNHQQNEPVLSHVTREFP
jgi:hypothetical protein